MYFPLFYINPAHPPATPTAWPRGSWRTSPLSSALSNPGFAPARCTRTRSRRLGVALLGWPQDCPPGGNPEVGNPDIHSPRLARLTFSTSRRWTCLDSTPASRKWLTFQTMLQGRTQHPFLRRWSIVYLSVTRHFEAWTLYTQKYSCKGKKCPFM